MLIKNQTFLILISHFNARKKEKDKGLVLYMASPMSERKLRKR
jgi:hypothetical protein